MRNASSVTPREAGRVLPPLEFPYLPAPVGAWSMRFPRYEDRIAAMGRFARIELALMLKYDASQNATHKDGTKS